MLSRRIALFLLAALLTGCHATTAGATDARTDVERIPVKIATPLEDAVFQAEIADSPAERTRGLMFRAQLGEREGMLFLFPREEQLSFWMRNTLIPLDMIFIKSDHTILGVVENAEPRTETSRFVPGASQFVLEINGGAAHRLGIRAGQRVEFFAPVPLR